MSFLVFYYMLFVFITAIIYYLANEKFKIKVLLISSILFISYLSFYALIFSFVFTIINFKFGLYIEKYVNNKNVKTNIFWTIIFLDIGFLLFFKFFISSSFFISILNSYNYNKLLVLNPIVLPIGLSYYTFQSIGYIIRINRRSEKVEHSLEKFALYLLFFPKFLSGPVERSNNFFPQLNLLPTFNVRSIEDGLKLFFFGLFKKIIIADSLFIPLTNVYNNIHSFGGLSLIIVLIFQTIFIYTDFSGYTDMAIGSANIFGITLKDNFKRPFLAKTVSDYWKRWHISLSSWCNDFIYNPFIVKYRKYGNIAVIIGLFITFLIMGIWHGSNVNYIILGLLQGVAIVYETYTKNFRIKISKKLPLVFINRISRILVYIFMSISMVFFFSNSFSDSIYFISHLFTEFNLNINSISFIHNKLEFIVAIISFLLIFVLEIFTEKGYNPLLIIFNKYLFIRISIYLIISFLLYFFHPVIRDFYYTRF